LHAVGVVGLSGVRHINPDSAGNGGGRPRQRPGRAAADAAPCGEPAPRMRGRRARRRRPRTRRAVRRPPAGRRPATRAPQSRPGSPGEHREDDQAHAPCHRCPDRGQRNPPHPEPRMRAPGSEQPSQCRM
jgi:hypothetical protein